MDSGAHYISRPCQGFTAFIVSWLECFFILPNHLQHFAGRMPPLREKMMQKIAEAYGSFLKFAMGWRYALLTLSLAGIGAFIVFVVLKVRQNWNLHVNNAYVSINMILNESDSLEDTHRQLQPLLADLREILPAKSYQDISETTGVFQETWPLRKSHRIATIQLDIDNNHPTMDSAVNQLGQLVQPIVERHRGKTFQYIELTNAPFFGQKPP